MTRKRGQQYKSEKELDAMLPMPKELGGQSITHGIAKQSSVEKLYQQQVGSDHKFCQKLW